MGWFYGFKLHLISNDEGELLACHLTPGNIDDREPVCLLSASWWVSSLVIEAIFLSPCTMSFWDKDLSC